jgi:hypothetical protein
MTGAGARRLQFPYLIDKTKNVTSDISIRSLATEAQKNAQQTTN